MPAQSVTNAVAVRDNGPGALIEHYRADFTAVLPSHVKPETWVRLATGALRRDPKVAEAAANNTGAFLGALLTAARLGLEPGTEQFYLVPQSPRANAPKEIMGVTGYQGLVELMYRAGAVSSVIVECVYSGDGFSYVPGRDERPVHEIDWDAENRGALRLVYAYAVMKDGATSKVVVLNKSDIARIRESSRSAKSDYSPWNKHESSMWMKSAARQLAKWVPTSAEYMRERLRAAAEVAGEQRPGVSSGLSSPNGVPVGDAVEGELMDADEPHPFAQQQESDRCARCGGFADDDIHRGAA
jgi:recombination protein RecT